MDQNFSSAAAALAGATIGGMASLGSSWVTQWVQLRDKNREIEHSRREALYSEFITEAARLFGDALSHEKDEVTDMVRLYALVARMRLIAPEAVVLAAEHTLRQIIDTYLAPNLTLKELQAVVARGGTEFLIEFSEACRRDLG
jgi:hypothetical protein